MIFMSSPIIEHDEDTNPNCKNLLRTKIQKSVLPNTEPILEDFCQIASDLANPDPDRFGRNSENARTY